MEIGNHAHIQNRVAWKDVVGVPYPVEMVASDLIKFKDLTQESSTNRVSHSSVKTATFRRFGTVRVSFSFMSPDNYTSFKLVAGTTDVATYQTFDEGTYDIDTWYAVEHDITVQEGDTVSAQCKVFDADMIGYIKDFRVKFNYNQLRQNAKKL